MGKLTDRLSQILWDEVIGRDEVHIKTLDMDNVRRFFMRAAGENAKVFRCGLKIEPKGNHYVITQLMLDKEGKVLRDGSDFYVGRQIYAEQLDDSVIEFMAGKTLRLMDLPY